MDTLGNLLHVSVHAANRSDTKAADPVLARGLEKYPSIKAFSGDAGYGGTAVTFVDETLGLVLHISRKIKDGWAGLSYPSAGSWRGHLSGWATSDD
ncbi:MAG: hypothetical protein QJT81_20995 [Candidatus Thiothrix putei]|uniref:Transposase IS4-like domain-containing protein n=1 Tax=Candidatus Thiothrix putei TaxID=3080811 RepID=A0AA95HFS9_9GAMM|nr:MAG: hypothetical protein QJT81_20995 [Candidatus Thiothrix putei]